MSVPLSVQVWYLFRFLCKCHNCFVFFITSLSLSHLHARDLGLHARTRQHSVLPSFAKEPCKRDYILQKRPVILRSLRDKGLHARTRQHSATHCNTLQHSATLTLRTRHCNTVSFDMRIPKQPVCCSVLQYVAVCCSVLQCVAVCCSVLQCDAVCCSVLQCVAMCCSVLQSHMTCAYQNNHLSLQNPCVRWFRIIFCKRATKYMALLRKMTYKDKTSYGSSPPC